MKEAKRLFLDKAIEEAGNRHFERAKVNEAVPALRRRIGDVIRRHMSLPDEINGHKVSNTGYFKFNDCIDTAINPTLTGSMYQKLSPTELECTTFTKIGKNINVTLSSSIYPSKDEAKTIKDPEARPARLYVDIKQLDYYYGLGIEGGMYIRYKEGSRHKRTEVEEANMGHIKELREVMELIQSRGTKFFPKPYRIL